jgi:hypothetical protein
MGVVMGTRNNECLPYSVTVQGGNGGITNKNIYKSIYLYFHNLRSFVIIDSNYGTATTAYIWTCILPWHTGARKVTPLRRVPWWDEDPYIFLFDGTVKLISFA